MEVVYLNGDYLPQDQAKVSVLDRGFVFGDGVYEVLPVYNGRFFRLEEHLARLQHSLDGVRIVNPHTLEQWRALTAQLLQRNAPAAQQTVYVQITRGVAKRDHAFPKGVAPTVFAMVNAVPPLPRGQREQGIAAITVADLRWARCDIKAITLLPNVLMRQEALDAGAQDAILVRDGTVTEGAASNLFIVKNGTVITPPKGPHLLPGITRDVVLELAWRAGIPSLEATVTVEELHRADEIWLTSSNKEVQSVTRLNHQPVGEGLPGPLWRRVTKLYDEFKATL